MFRNCCHRWTRLGSARQKCCKWGSWGAVFPAAKFGPGSRGCRVAACRAMVRPRLGCAAPIRSPCHQTEISRIEKVQKTAARWACRRWRNQSRVGEMLEELQWPELQKRRQQASLTFFYKVHNSLVTVGGVGCLSWAGVGGFHPFWCRCPSTYVSNICIKANRTIGFLRRNISACPQDVKELAYDWCAQSWSMVVQFGTPQVYFFKRN